VWSHFQTPQINEIFRSPFNFHTCLNFLLIRPLVSSFTEFSTKNKGKNYEYNGKLIKRFFCGESGTRIIMNWKWVRCCSGESLMNSWFYKRNHLLLFLFLPFTPTACPHNHYYYKYVASLPSHAFHFKQKYSWLLR